MQNVTVGRATSDGANDTYEVGIGNETVMIVPQQQPRLFLENIHRLINWVYVAAQKGR